MCELWLGCRHLQWCNGYDFSEHAVWKTTLTTFWQYLDTHHGRQRSPWSVFRNWNLQKICSTFCICCILASSKMCVDRSCISRRICIMLAIGRKTCCSWKKIVSDGRKKRAINSQSRNSQRRFCRGMTLGIIQHYQRDWKEQNDIPVTERLLCWCIYLR